MEKQSRLESALARGKKTAETVLGFFKEVPDMYRKAREEKSELAAVDFTIYGDLRDLLLYSAKYFGSRPQLDFGSGEAAEEFYNIIASKLDRGVYRRLQNKDVARISNKLDAWMRGLYDQSYRVIASLRKTYGARANLSIALPLSIKQAAGLVSSYLLNNSEKAYKIKFHDGKALTMEYLGAFAKNGKSVVVYGDAGKNFGYKREDGSILYSYNKGGGKISRLRTALHSVTDSFQRDVSLILELAGGMYLSALGISLLQYKNILPLIPAPYEACTLQHGCNISIVNVSALELIVQPIGGLFGDASFASLFTIGAACIFAGVFLYDSVKRYKERRYNLDFAEAEEKNLKRLWDAVQRTAIARCGQEKDRDTHGKEGDTHAAGK